MAYVGPGDIVSGALSWWGLRAYSSAKAATAPYPGINICDIGTGNQQDINILSTGDLDVAALNTWIASFGTAYLFILYDQISTLNLTGNQAFVPLVVSPAGLATGRVAVNAIGNAQFGSGGTITTVQPFTISTFYNCTNSATEGWLFSNSSATIPLFNDRGNVANLAGFFAGIASLNATAAESAWHAVQGVYNGVSSDVNVDGTSNTGITGTNVISNDTVVLFSASNVAWRGDWVELGLWSNKGFSSTESGNMNANQVAYWVTVAGGGGSLVFQAQTLAIPLLTTGNVKITFPIQ